MVIKSLSRRDPASIGQLLGYISREGANAAPLLHNLPLAAAMDLDAARAAFVANAAHLPARRNGVAYYHEILSLSDRVAVMYAGQIIDVLPIEQAERNTVGLLMAGVKPEQQKQEAAPVAVGGVHG